MDRRSFMSAHSCVLRQDSGKNIIYTRRDHHGLSMKNLKEEMDQQQ
jgi:hypothetical protein